MKAVPFAAYLESRRRNLEPAEAAPQPVDTEEPAPPLDLEAMQAQARQSGYDEGYAAAVAKYEKRLAAQQEGEGERIEAAKKQTLVREANAYKRLAAREFEKMRSEIEAQISTILKSLFGAAFEQKASQETIKLLRELLDIRKVGEIRVSANQKLVDAIREGLGASAHLVSFDVADQPDISISFGQTRIRTQISQWKEKLEQLSGGRSDV